MVKGLRSRRERLVSMLAPPALSSAAAPRPCPAPPPQPSRLQLPPPSLSPFSWAVQWRGSSAGAPGTKPAQRSGLRDALRWRGSLCPGSPSPSGLWAPLGTCPSPGCTEDKGLGLPFTRSHSPPSSAARVCLLGLRVWPAAGPGQLPFL